MSTEEIRAIVAKCEPRARMAAAIANVCGITSSDYLPMIETCNALRRVPGEAGDLADWTYSEHSYQGAANMLSLMLQVLEVTEGLDVTDARGVQRDAMRTWCETLKARLSPAAEVQ